MNQAQQEKVFFTKLQPSFYTRLLLAGNFLVPYLRFVEQGTELSDVSMPSPTYFAKITTSAEVEDFCSLIEAVGENGELNLSDREVTMVYITLVLMSYGLITPLGERVGEFIMEEFPVGHRLKEFDAYRNHNIQKNDLIISRLGPVMEGYPGFEEVKKEIDLLAY